MGTMESQTEEWKESWHDDCLNDINAFANTDGGRLFVGRNDKGVITGIRNARKLMEEIPNTVYNKMNFHPDVRTLTENGKEYVVVTVKRQKEPVFNGDSLFIRSGSTTKRLTGKQLMDFLLRRTGQSWTDIEVKNAKLSNLSPEAIDTFVRKGIASNRMSSAAVESDHGSLLKRYELINEDGMVTRAAVILFSESPLRVTYAATTKIGAFSEDDRLLRDDRIDGPIVLQPDRVMDKLLDKYVQGVYDIKGLQRFTKYPYPEKALREAVMNATVHRDYSCNMDTSIKVYPDRVEIFNPGRLPEGWTEKELTGSHGSEPANPLIAKVFYEMEYIEQWGSGIGMMRKECENMGISHPEFNVGRDGITITFRRAPEKETVSKNESGTADLTVKEKKVYQVICEGVATTLDEISLASGVSVASVKRATKSLIEKEMIIRVGSKMDGKWIRRDSNSS